MKNERYPDGLFTPLLTELGEIEKGARNKGNSHNALMPPGYTPEGLQKLGLFLLRSEVWQCLVYGVREMEKFSIALPRGRPKVPELQSLDARRAYRLWDAVTNMLFRTMTNRDLIALMQKIEARFFNGKPEEILFPRSVSFGTLEQSVSRGKRALQIDANWKSALCEKISGI